jgi:hypothetical protein
MVFRLLWRVVLFLLIAFVVVAMGTSSGRPTAPDAGPVPQPTTAELASRSMLGLANAADRLAEGAAPPATGSPSTGSGSPSAGSVSGPGTRGVPPSSAGTVSPHARSIPLDPKTSAALHSVSAMLRAHVRLLAPGLPEPALQALPAAGAPETPAEAATALARSGNDLMAASLGAAPDTVRATLGAGIEQRLAATELATAAAGATSGPKAAAKAAAALPDPAIPTAAQGWKAASGVVLGVGSCPAAASGAPSAPAGAAGTPSPTQQGDQVARRGGRALAGAADAAFRLAYAYQFAAARLGAGNSATAWSAAADSEDLGRRLAAVLPEPCAAVRRPAYRMPAGFDKHPLASAAAGEEQLAALLRDAAAEAPSELRAPLVRAAWDAARAGLSRTGSSPALT